MPYVLENISQNQKGWICVNRDSFYPVIFEISGYRIIFYKNLLFTYIIAGKCKQASKQNILQEFIYFSF